MAATLRLVPDTRPILARLRDRLSRRYYRCAGCRAVSVRRLRGKPREFHWYRCLIHEHRCGRWERIDKHDLCAQRHRLLPLGERWRVMRDS